MNYTPRKRDRQLHRRYGITLAQYEELLSQQAGTCAICSRPAKPHRALAVDHSHTSGSVRGLLCDPCNAALGAFQDSPKVLTRALAYLLKET